MSFRRNSLISIITGIICVAVLAAIGVVGYAYASANSQSSASHTTVFNAIVPELSTPRTAQVFNNIQYCNTNNPQQALDIYTPAYQPYQLAPAVVIIHGGGWSSGDKVNGFMAFYKDEMLKKGWAVVSINHRLAPRSTYPSQNQDIACALNYLHTNASSYGIDRDRLALFGESSGAQLANAVVLSPDNDQAPWKSSIKAVVSYYAVSDFTQLLTNKLYRGNARMYLGKTPQLTAAKASIVKQPITSAPPFLIFHGDSDPVVPYSQSVELYNYVKTVQPDTQLVLVKNGTHGFTHRGTPTLLQIRQLMLNFLSQRLAPPLSRITP